MLAQKPELFVGLVGPIGSSMDTLVHVLGRCLHKARYSFLEIRLIEETFQLKGFEDVRESDVFKSYQHRMTKGTELRTVLGAHDALAVLGMAKASNQRGGTTPSGIAYIFRSLKHPEEAETLRKTYGAGFT